MKKTILAFLCTAFGSTPAFTNPGALDFYVQTCSTPNWLLQPDTREVKMEFTDEVVGAESLLLNKEIDDPIEISIWVPKPPSMEVLPKHFWVVLSTPSRDWPIVGQMYHHASVYSYARQNEQRDIVNWSRDAYRHISDDGTTLLYKDRTIPDSGATVIVGLFWENVTRSSYQHFISQSEQDYLAIDRGNDLEKYDHFYSFEEMPWDIDRHFAGSGHRVLLNKKIREKGKAYAFILDLQGYCLASRIITIQ